MTGAPFVMVLGIGLCIGLIIGVGCGLSAGISMEKKRIRKKIDAMFSSGELQTQTTQSGRLQYESVFKQLGLPSR